MRGPDGILWPPAGFDVSQKLRQSIEDEIAYDKKEPVVTKAGIAANSEQKAATEDDLDVTSTDVASGTQELGDLHEECMTTAETFEAGVKSRAEELKALAEAKIVTENTSGAESIPCGLS